jgi:hypothetical protein
LTVLKGGDILKCNIEKIKKMAIDQSLEGLKRFSRPGIVFSESQKDMIKKYIDGVDNDETSQNRGV